MSTVSELAAQIRAGTRSADDVARETLATIAEADAHFSAFRETIDTPQKASDGPLGGVPIAIKDNIVSTLGTTTAGSQILDGYASPFDATVVTRLRDAGAVIVGKTNCDEFGMGSSNENCSYAQVRNPWDPERVPGGSSGGSAVAVAADLVPVALGTDTGGSIRQPASFCGIVGLKPTYGRVSRYGLIAYGSSLDTIGPMARSTADVAEVLQVIAGHDSADATCVDQPVPDYRAAIEQAEQQPSVAGLKIGVPEIYFGEGLDPEVAQAVQAALDLYRQNGAELVPVELPHVDKAIAAYYVIATAECSSNLARFDGVRFGHRDASPDSIETMTARSRGAGFGPEVKRRIMLGTFVLSSGYYGAYYDKALRVRRLIQQGFQQALSQVDLIACPTAPTTAFPFGEKTDNPLQMYLADIYTLAVNLAGLPAISIPCGFDSAGMPIGLQMIGSLFDEAGLLGAARRYEGWTDWHTRRPEMRRG